MRSRGLWAFAVVGVLVLAISAVYATPQQLVLEVRVGEKGERGDTRAGEQHSITLDALREGKTKFWVEGEDDQYVRGFIVLDPEAPRCDPPSGGGTGSSPDDPGLSCLDVLQRAGGEGDDGPRCGHHRQK